MTFGNIVLRLTPLAVLAALGSFLVNLGLSSAFDANGKNAAGAEFTREGWSRVDKAGRPVDGATVVGPATVGAGDGVSLSATQTVSSTATSCMQVGPNWGGGATSNEQEVLVVWNGTAGEARLVLDQSGASYWQDILVNGTKVGSSEADAYEVPCESWRHLEIDIDPSLVRKGINTITIQDKYGNDDWSISDARIVVSGEIAGASISEVYVRSSYDSSLRRFSSLRPASYNGYTPFPVIVVVGGWGDDSYDGINWFGEAANRRSFLLLSPDKHGERTGGGTSLAARAAQRDIMDAIDYATSNYQVDASRIYLVGVSMGGMTAAITAAKYPDIFAAAVEFVGPTDLKVWYQESTWRKSYIENEAGGTPAQVPFEYERRSPVQLAPNLRHLPFAIVHGNADITVDPHHASDLANAMRAYGSDVRIRWYDGGHTDFGVVYNQDWTINFLTPYYRIVNPSSLAARTDESKSYYWLEIVQTGGDHWTEVSASRQQYPNVIQAVVTDTRAVTLRFDLANMGLPTTVSYLVEVRDLLTGQKVTNRQSPTSGKISVDVASGSHALTLTDEASAPTATPTSTATRTATATPTRTSTPTATPTSTTLSHRVFLPIVFGNYGGSE